MKLTQWLEYQGFGPLITFPGDHQTYENTHIANGGIRIEIAGEVASIYCIQPKCNVLAVHVQDVRMIVENMLFAKGILRK